METIETAEANETAVAQVGRLRLTGRGLIAVEQLRGEASDLGERYKRERVTVEKIRTEEVEPMIVTLSRIPLTQLEIAELLQVHRTTVANVQHENGMARPRRRREAT